MANSAVDLLERELDEIRAQLAGYEELRRNELRIEGALAILRGETVLPGASAFGAAGPRRASTGQRAPRGQNRQLILTTVGDHPGITVAEVAERTGIGRPTVATTVSKLKRDGVLDAEGDGLRLVA